MIILSVEPHYRPRRKWQLLLTILLNQGRTFKEKRPKNTNEFCLKVFGKLKFFIQTAWKSDSYFLRYCNFIVSKWLPRGAAILKQILKPKSMKLNLCLKNIHLCLLCKWLFFMELFYEYCTFIRHYWKKKSNVHCELVTSQPHWFSGSQLDISKCSIFNNFLVFSPICMKFVRKSLV